MKLPHLARKSATVRDAAAIMNSRSGQPPEPTPSENAPASSFLSLNAEEAAG